MHYYVMLAIEAEDAAEATERADIFVSDYPDQSDYHRVDEVFKIADRDRQNGANDTMRLIEDALSYKDARIAEGLEAFRPISTDAQKVVESLKPESDYTSKMRSMWTEALKTDGRSMAMHRNSFAAETGLFLYLMKKTLVMMGDSFHNEAAFYDIEEMATSPEALQNRLEERPESQWIVVMDLHN